MPFLFLKNRKNHVVVSADKMSYKISQGSKLGTLPKAALWDTPHALVVYKEDHAWGSELMNREHFCAACQDRERAKEQARLQHTTFSPRGKERSQLSHKSLACLLHPGSLQCPLFSELSLPFLKETLYYPEKSCGFPLISILKRVFSSFQVCPNMVHIHSHTPKHCLDYFKKPN